jgi:hypothetical protein
MSDEEQIGKMLQRLIEISEKSLGNQEETFRRLTALEAESAKQRHIIYGNGEVGIAEKIRLLEAASAKQADLATDNAQIKKESREALNEAQALKTKVNTLLVILLGLFLMVAGRLVLGWLGLIAD